VATTIGILHPGAMGISVAASAQNSGNIVYWASEGRSSQTADRAARINLLDAYSLASICEICSVIFSVCPPAAAEAQANDILALGFKGLYVDMNAIAPQRVQRIAEHMVAHGTRFVSGSIIGGPAWKPNTTWLYLSGEDAQSVVDLFIAGPLETQVLGDDITKATALKMCFAAYTKGTTALLCAVMAAAESLNVRDDLERQWSRNGSTFAEESARNVQQVTAKAWRFSGEMEEIAATMSSAGVPDGFHLAAADIYQRMTDFKGADPLPSLDEILVALIQKPTEPASLKTTD
jgi:3-hydroxyisobutyrate dehydrogenase-like beta-hydroxyacid dehydrogenase